MRNIILLVLIISFYSTFLKAEVVTSIEITGNSRVSDETIKLYGDIKLNKNYQESDLNQILNNLYETEFFQDVKVELSKGVLIINLEEHPVINELIILGEPSNKYKKEINRIIRLKKQESFIKNYLSEDVAKIKSLYSSLGYNFVEVETKIRKIDEKRLDLIFDINRGDVTKISKITFTGDKKIRERRLRDVIASTEDKFYKFISRNTRFSQNLVELDVRLLENYYKSLGYYDVKVVSNSAQLKKSGNVELTYSIDAGQRYVIKKITTNVDSVFDKKLFFPLNKKYNKIIGDYHSPFKIKNLLEEIDELIARNNLQFVEHNVEETVEGNSIIIKFNIFEGEKVSVERINILGNNVTNESVIRSELILDEGDPFTNLSLNKSLAKIRSRNIFSSVKSEIKEGSSNNLKIIDISVEEKPTGEISAGAGVGTNGGSVGFNIKENNWLGEGKNLSFDFEINQESIKGNLEYLNPNYDFLGNSISYSLNSTTNDKPDQGYENTIVGAGIETRFEQYKNIFASLGLGLSYDDLRTLSSASDTLKKQSGEFTEVSGNYGFTYDGRNRAFMPTSGSIVGFSQTLPFYADKSFISNTITASSYSTLTENIIGAAKFYVSSVNGLSDDDVRLSKRRFLNSKRLRGFERGKIGPVDGTDHIGGNYAASLNFEANLPNLLPEDTRTDVGLFLDFGNVWGVDYDSTIDDSNKIRSSTGVAASWMSPLGPMTFVFSTDISSASTDKTESFNFNLGTTF